VFQELLVKEKEYKFVSFFCVPQAGLEPALALLQTGF